ncbi:hypothetical protein EVA_22240 [gut metagenome]|uniref:Uncharacterized protein n=1 Tax=gut metagenome TaxID=749906 RepID=J9BQ02_9ZZZZ
MNTKEEPATKVGRLRVHIDSPFGQLYFINRAGNRPTGYEANIRHICCKNNRSVV